MILSYSVLHYFPDLQDFCAVFWQGWATDNRKSSLFAFQTFVFAIFEGK